MSVWYCCPSKRPPEQAGPVLAKWQERGYRVAVARDAGDAGIPDIEAVYIPWPGPYRGYAKTMNKLCGWLLKYDPTVEWIVCGADDVEPDPNHTAEEIAYQCGEYFSCRWEIDRRIGHLSPTRKTFGVMQPTGDRWGDAQGPYIDRVAGSPWIGREFARRMYGGKGPYWPEFYHMFVDEHLMCVAQKLGVFWQRPDLTHYHEHWGRPRKGELMGQSDRMPAFLAKANSAEHWRTSKAIFDRLKAGGFEEANNLLP